MASEACAQAICAKCQNGPCATVEMRLDCVTETMEQPMSAILSELKRLRAQAQDRLMRNSEDYRALIAIEEAIRKIDNEPTRVSTSRERTQVRAPYAVSRYRERRVSQAEAALREIETKGQPLTTTELLELLTNVGVSVSGERPEINLSSALSRDDRLQSISVDGERKWWFADRPPPQTEGLDLEPKQSRGRMIDQSSDDDE